MAFNSAFKELIDNKLIEFWLNLLLDYLFCFVFLLFKHKTLKQERVGKIVCKRPFVYLHFFVSKFPHKNG
jgi:hypothetical protein